MALQISQDKLCIMQQKTGIDQQQINMILLAILKNKLPEAWWPKEL